MTKAQRTTLKILLLLDIVMILYPPYEAGFGSRVQDLGHHWVSFLRFLETDTTLNNSFVYGESSHINFVKLAAQVGIASVIGLTAFLFAKTTSDEKFDATLARVPIICAIARRWL
jgi:hypothetical protein